METATLTVYGHRSDCAKKAEDICYVLSKLGIDYNCVFDWEPELMEATIKISVNEREL